MERRTHTHVGIESFLLLEALCIKAQPAAAAAAKNLFRETGNTARTLIKTNGDRKVPAFWPVEIDHANMCAHARKNALMDTRVRVKAALIQALACVRAVRASGK